MTQASEEQGGVHDLARQPIKAMDDQPVEQLGVGVHEQTFQSGALEVLAGSALIVIAKPAILPPAACLRANELLAHLELCIARRKLLLRRPGLPGVDRATGRCRRDRHNEAT
ncbi:MAG: hypothetical protein KF847_08280 [Pirellulales bacterium]|nr:hypothetical protein [Pirellulales bacterium]